MKKITVITSGIAAVTLVLGVIQAQGQSVTFNFSDGTADGWANAGFGGSPAATVANIGGQNYIALPLGGFQVGNYGTGNTSDPFYAAMAAAAANPAGYNISYDYYIDTSGFTGAGFLQLGTYVNSGSGYYAQDFGATKEVELNGTQLTSGQVFSGHVSVNMAAVGFAIPPADNFFRLGLIENGSGTGVVVDFSNISVSPAPEPSTFALIGLGAAATMLMLRRRMA
jgi:PEP-CTERM motif